MRGSGTAFRSGAPVFTPRFQWGSLCSIVSFLCNDLQIVVCPFVLFLLTIELSVLRYTDFDCPFGIFKFFFLWSLYCLAFKLRQLCYLRPFLNMQNVVFTQIMLWFRLCGQMIDKEYNTNGVKLRISCTIRHVNAIVFCMNQHYEI